MYSFEVNLVENKKVRFDYETLEEVEGGLELFGHEVKSLRARRGKLEGAHIVVRPSGRACGYEAYIVGMDIPPYQAANTPKEYDSMRSRKLLLTKKELIKLANAEGQKGLTIVPIAVYNKGSKLKMRLAIARGRKNYDKRSVLKERDTKRDIQRVMKGL